MEIIKVNDNGSKLIYENGEYYNYMAFNICKVCKKQYDETKCKNYNLCGSCYMRQYRKNNPNNNYYNKNREQILMDQQMRRLFIKLFQQN
tara:strand:+ start:1010 stop:1279 length:270 start_codon:yes stop_codon:yes gene_type:complete